MKLTREQELNILRLKIMDTIRFSKSYWMIYKEKTFGFATILNLMYKKSYIEVLFYPNNDVLNLGVPLLKINTPIETEVDFNELLLNPVFDADGLMSPIKVLKQLNNLIRNEFQHHISILDKEIELIQEKYESYIIDKIPYHRTIRVYFSNFFIEFEIDFEKYPLMPKIDFTEALSKIIRLNEFLEKKMFKEWEEDNPPHVIDIIEELIKIIITKLQINNLPDDSQHLLLYKTSIEGGIKNVSFKLLRGQSIGILYDEKKSSIGSNDDTSSMKKFFEAIVGRNQFFTGIIKVFGKNIQLGLEKDLGRIALIPPKLSLELKNLTLKKALLRNVYVKPEWRSKKSNLDLLLKKVGLLSIKDDVFPVQPKYDTKKGFIDSILEITGLLNRKKDKVRNLSSIEQVLFLFARALLKKPAIILFSFPSTYFGKVEIEKLNKCVQKIQEEYHSSVIIHGTKDAIEVCDQIITISHGLTEIGSLADFVDKLPQSGEILTIELSHTDKEVINKMFELDSVIFIEERRNEKYKLFIEENPEIVIIFLMELFGANLYSFKRFRANMDDYFEFYECKKHGRLYKMRK